MDLKQHIINVNDYPKKGVVFYDITPILNNSAVYNFVINEMVKYVQSVNANVILAPEARGFWFASAVAYVANIRFIPVRKPNKLPRAVIEQNYSLEYGENQLQMHINDLKPDDQVVIIDDVLATGGTCEAICTLVERQNAQTVGLVFLLELLQLNGKLKIKDYNYYSLLQY